MLIRLSCKVEGQNGASSAYHRPWNSLFSQKRKKQPNHEFYSQNVFLAHQFALTGLPSQNESKGRRKHSIHQFEGQHKGRSTSHHRPCYSLLSQKKLQPRKILKTSLSHSILPYLAIPKWKQESTRLQWAICRVESQEWRAFLGFKGIELEGGAWRPVPANLGMSNQDEDSTA